MSDSLLEHRLANLSEFMNRVPMEAKAAPAKGKAKPVPPWMQSSSTNDDDDDDTSADDSDDDSSDADDQPPWKKKPAKGKVGKGSKALPHTSVPAGFHKKRPVAAQNTSKVRRKPAASNMRGNRTAKLSKGTPVKLNASQNAPKPQLKAAARPTVWGPPSKNVNIRRAGVDGVGSDARIRRQAGQTFHEGRQNYGTGHAGGNGVTSGNSRNRATAKRPGNVRGQGPREQVHKPVGEMGEGRVWGRSGSAIVPHKPGNIKGLYEWSSDEVQSALAVVTKALSGVVADHEQYDEA